MSWWSWMEKNACCLVGAAGPSGTVLIITWVLELPIGWFKLWLNHESCSLMSLVYPEIWITQFGALERELWTKQSRMVQQPQNRQHASTSSNFIKPSHASFNLFLLPTHNSTYHLASTTRDLSTNLGFKILCSWTWRTPNKNHQITFFAIFYAQNST